MYRERGFRCRQRDLLATIPGIGPKAAAAIIAEIGTSPGEFFTTGAHLASWAGLCPGNHESAGKRKHGKAVAARVTTRGQLPQSRMRGCCAGLAKPDGRRLRRVRSRARPGWRVHRA